MKLPRTEGPEGIILGHRGKSSNNRMPAEIKKKNLERINADYSEFEPTLASEKL